ncbi:MAG TPA: hypothetical protein VL403_10100 [Candidatus Kryptonia bacterium]|nr:hypothetical protein [Candidatus Kryptonia bacterium]
MSRPRTTKELAKRIELNYYRRAGAWQRWRRNLSIAAAAVAAAWLSLAALRGDRRLYNSGPVSVRHAVFGAQCQACHVHAGDRRFFLHTSDRACLACHDGPRHHETQMFSPECASCHVEHKGRVVLTDLDDRHCTRCHENLRLKDGITKFEAQVADFSTQHPEFAVLRSKIKDAAAVKLNHQVHLKASLRGPTGPVQMVCGDCHRAQSSPKAWPYGKETTRAPQPYTRGAYMQPISYADHCIGCHPLGFDARMTESVPHDRPEVIRAFLRLRFLDYASAHPESLAAANSDDDEGGGLRRRSEDEQQTPVSLDQWVGTQIAAAEELLYQPKNTGCQLCHTLAAAAELPKVVATAIPSYWFAHARFDHRTHRELRCLACHEKAPTSQDTADVLLPGIEICRQCHMPSAGARSGCVECHRYHDKSRERDEVGPLRIQQLVSGTSQ